MSRASTRPPAPAKELLKAFYHALPLGRPNARTAEQIGRLLGWISEYATPAQIENGKRRVRLCSQYAVYEGFVYCADNDGYFRPEANELAELSATIGRRESQAVEHFEWCRQMRANLNARLHQASLL